MSKSRLGQSQTAPRSAPSQPASKPAERPADPGYQYGASENGFSTRAQWQEKVARPVAARAMNDADVAEFCAVLASVEGVDPSEIVPKCIKITDYNDEDRHDCVYLVFRAMRMNNNGTLAPTTIWRMKVPLPEHIKQQHKNDADAFRNSMPRRRRPVATPQLMAPPRTSPPAASPPKTSPPKAAAKAAPRRK